MPQSTTKKSAQATSGLARRRAGALRSVARSHRRGVPGQACSASVIGAPSNRSGAAIIVSSRCWTMWTENEVVTAASIGPVRAMTTTPRPAKKARRARGRGTRRRARRTRASATRYTSAAVPTPSATGSANGTMHSAFYGHAPAGRGELLGGDGGRTRVHLERQLDLEGRPGVDPARDVDPAEMCLDDGSHDRQPKSEAACVAAAAGIRTSEAVEDAIEVFRRDPGPRVAERHDRRSVAAPDTDLDRVLLLRVLHRVLDHRIERHGETVPVGKDGRLLGGPQHPPPGRGRPPAQCVG